MVKDISSNKCENCSSLIIQKYGSGRFCSQKCARSFSTKSKRKEINEKLSKIAKEKNFVDNLKQYSFSNEETRTKAQEVLRKNREEKFGKWEERKVCLGSLKKGVFLDITNYQLEEYRKNHLVCDICGNPEKISTQKNGTVSRLSVDHDHKTNKFRGLLCYNCNRKLGWYELYKEDIKRYLASSSNG